MDDPLHEREPLPLEEAHALIRRIIRDGKVGIRKHARERMAERNLTMQDALNTLRAGRILAAEHENREWRYRACTTRMCFLVAFRSETELSIVTGWRV